MIPTVMKQILSVLRSNGYAAFFVGGCVRDLLLHRQMNDWDIATAATPVQVAALFEHTVPTGIKHGTITVLYAGTAVEITTFRVEGGYQDSRHPNRVQFVDSLVEDLRRRDFTVNAMAMDADGQVTDCFGGREDLKNKILRCVGDPVERFAEDALRIFRAFRFSAQLGFTIAPETLAAARQCAGLCEKLSVERVRDELEKTICSERPQILAQMAEYGLLARFGITGRRDCALLARVENRRIVRWSAAMVCLPELAGNVMRLDKQTQRTAAAAAALYRQPWSRLACKRMIAAYGEAVAACCAALHCQQEVINEIIASGECVSLRQLAVGGNDLPDCPPEQIGRYLTALLDEVLVQPEKNTREYLLERYRRLCYTDGQ